MLVGGWKAGCRIFKSMGVERQCPGPESAVEIPWKTFGAVICHYDSSAQNKKAIQTKGILSFCLSSCCYANVFAEEACQIWKWSTSQGFALVNRLREARLHFQQTTQRPPHLRPHPKSFTARFLLLASTSQYFRTSLPRNLSETFPLTNPSSAIGVRGAFSKTIPHGFHPTS